MMTSIIIDNPSAAEVNAVTLGKLPAGTVRP
jgi:hypothetical protein